MASYDKSIIKEIRRKGDGEFEEPIPLGTDQWYVGALLNSHNNNLEEQTIIGVDYFAIVWNDANNIYHMTKKFYNGDISSISSNGYYILFVTDYSNTIKEAEANFDNSVFYLRPHTDSATVLLSDNLDLNVYDSTGAIKVDADYVTVRQEVLCFRTDLSNTSDEQITSDVIISTKTVEKKVNEDGKIYYRQSIINSLGS